MELQFVSCLRFSMQLLMAEAFFVFRWPRKHHFVVRLFAGFVGYGILATAVFTLLNQFKGRNPIFYMIYYCSLFLLSLGIMKLSFQAKEKEILFAGVCGYAAQHIAFSISMMMQQVLGLSLTGWMDFLWIRFLPYILVDFLLYFFILKRYDGKGELKDRDIRMIILSFSILMIVIFISVLVDSSLFRADSGMIRNVICKLYAIFCCMLSIFIAFGLSRQNKITHENEMMENMLHNLKEQQKLSQETINIINIKCHDLKYRISKIAKIEDSESQKEYIESVKNTVAIYDNIYQTGNDALDLVLTEKSLLCEEHAIKWSSMIDGTVLNFMQTTDVYALFGNLFDNAIESVTKEPDKEKRIISTNISKKNQGYHIHMENYCANEVRFEDGLPVTTKADKNYHGFGVRSIKYIVEKYNGEMLMRYENHKFQVDILFPVK